MGQGSLGDTAKNGDGGGLGSILMGMRGTQSTGKFDGTSSGGQLDKRRLEDYDEAMRRIKDATGVSDVNEIIQKFATQHDTYNNLQDLKVGNERKLLDF